MMIFHTRALIASACLTLVAGCATQTLSTSGLTRATAEARYAEVQHLAVEHATQEGLEARFGTRAWHGHKLAMKNCVVLFTKDNTSVAAAECEIKDGKFTFRGTPVIKTGTLIKLGDQETLITADPKAEQHYEMTIIGNVESFPGK